MLGGCSYPFNNILHHQVESIVSSCLESNNQALLDHLFQDCDFVAKLLAAEENPFAPGTQLEVITSLKSKSVHYHGCNFFYICVCVQLIFCLLMSKRLSRGTS